MKFHTLLAIIATLSDLAAITFPVVVLWQALPENTHLLSPSLLLCFFLGLVFLPACVHIFRYRNISCKSILAHESSGFLIAGTYYGLVYQGWQDTPSIVPKQGMNSLSLEESADDAIPLGQMVTIMGGLLAEARHSGKQIESHNGHLKLLHDLAEKHGENPQSLTYIAAEIAMEAILARKDMLLPLVKRILDQGQVNQNEVWHLWHLTGQKNTDRREIQMEIKRIAPSLSYA